MGFGLSFIIDLKDNPFWDNLVLGFLLSEVKMNSGGKEGAGFLCIPTNRCTRDFVFRAWGDEANRQNADLWHYSPRVTVSLYRVCWKYLVNDNLAVQRVWCSFDQYSALHASLAPESQLSGRGYRQKHRVWLGWFLLCTSCEINKDYLEGLIEYWGDPCWMHLEQWGMLPLEAEMKLDLPLSAWT